MNIMKWFTFNQDLRDEWIAKVSKVIPEKAKILDAGCGSGRYHELFSHCRYLAQDFGMEPGTVGKYAKLDYECDITSIPLENGALDAVICTEVLEHLPEPIKAIQEFSRIVKPGGHLILTAPLGSRLHQRPYHFYGGFTPYWYEKFLPENGFDIVELVPNQGFFGRFAQEGRLFHALMDPRKTSNVPAVPRLLMSAMWVVLMPILRLAMPLLTPILDSYALTDEDAVGYHVLARRKI